MMFLRKYARASPPREAAETNRGRGGLGGGRGDGIPSSKMVMGRDPAGGRRDIGGGGGGVGLSRMAGIGHQRQRLQQRKHPEPLRRAIVHCLSASHPNNANAFTSEAVRTVQDYLANSSTMDSAYIVLIDHALAERDRSPPVIIKCVALLKRYLFRYVPKHTTLQKIDNFCSELIAECNALGGSGGMKQSSWLQPAAEQSAPRPPGTPMSPSITTLAFASASLVKSLIYVRALVGRRLSRYSSQQPPTTLPQIKPLKPAVPSPRNRPFSSPYDRVFSKRPTPEDREAAKSAAMMIAGLEEIDDEDGDYIAVDVLKWRWLGVKGRKAWAPSPVMLDRGGIARPHVERKSLGEQGASGLMVKAIQQKVNDFLLRNGERPGSSLEGIAEEMLLPSTVTAVTDQFAVKSHLRSVAVAKRNKSQTSQRWDGDALPSSLRRRPRPLFQYRHYSEQQPLRLSNAEMEEVVHAVCSEAAEPSITPVGIPTGLPNSQTGNIALESADVAASVLIKLLIDMYIADSQIAEPLTLYILLEMVKSQEKSVRIRAFDLILNLGVHAHLLEPMQVDEQTIVEDPSPFENGSFSSFGSFSGATARKGERHRLSRTHLDTSRDPFLEKPERGTPPAVGGFEAWLLRILYEMILVLVQTEEAEEGVWAAAFSCLLYLVCDRGRIRRDRLDGLDIRALKLLLSISWEYGWADEVHSRLIRISCNLLYRQPLSTDDSVFSNLTLDMKQLESFGGIDTICEQYGRAKTSEGRKNLLAVLFDYVIYGPEDVAGTSRVQVYTIEEIQAVATALTLAEAPECFAFAFKHGLSGVGVALAKAIGTAMARDVHTGSLNEKLLDDVVSTLDKLAASYGHPEEEFMDLLPVTLASEGLSTTIASELPQEALLDPVRVATAWSTLESLLHSSRASYRNSGYLWLLKLLAAEMARGGSKQSTKLKTNALQRQLGLLGKLERGAESEVPEIEKTAENQHTTPSISSAVRLLCGLLKSKNPSVRRGFVLILERVLIQCQRHGLDMFEFNLTSMSEGDLTRQEGVKSSGAQERALAMLGLMNGALWQAISANDTDRVNILQMCNMMLSQLCVSWPHSANQPTTKSILANCRSDSSLVDAQRPGLPDGVRDLGSVSQCGSSSGSVAAMLLSGQAAAPKLLVANMPTALLYWPLMQLAGGASEDITLGVAVGSRGGGNVPGGACDVRAALLLILIGKCTEYQVALDEVGGEEFFRSLLDDLDARVAYYTSAFLLKRMQSAEPEKYQRMLHNLVFKAQQSNNEKLLENPYLQIRGILQLSSESDIHKSFQSDSS